MEHYISLLGTRTREGQEVPITLYYEHDRELSRLEENSPELKRLRLVSTIGIHAVFPSNQKGLESDNFVLPEKIPKGVCAYTNSKPLFLDNDHAFVALSFLEEA